MVGIRGGAGSDWSHHQPSRHTEIDDQGRALRSKSWETWTFFEMLRLYFKKEYFRVRCLPVSLSPAPCFLDLPDQITQQSHKALGEVSPHQE